MEYNVLRIMLMSIIVCCSMVSSGCMEYIDGLLPQAPDIFEWRSSFFVKCSGQILSPLNTVDLTHENGYVLKDQAHVALSIPRITDYRAYMNITVQRGEGVRITLRKTVKGDSSIKGIILDYTQQGIIIRDGERIVMQTDTIKAMQGIEELIKIDSEGKTMRIEIGCAKPCIFTTEQLGTEYVFTSSLPQSTIAVNGLEFIPMRLSRPSIK